MSITLIADPVNSLSAAYLARERRVPGQPKMKPTEPVMNSKRAYLEHVPVTLIDRRLISDELKFVLWESIQVLI